MTNGLCVMSHRQDPDRPRRALDGAHLCHGHRGELERLIEELPGLADDLDRPAGVRGGRGSGGGGLVIDDRAAELRPRMAAVLASWCRVVYEDRGVNPPRSGELAHTVPWLLHPPAGHLDWLAAQPWIDEMIGELRGVTRAARGIVDLPARRIPLGQQCRVHADGERCTGEVTLIVRGDDWAAHCPACRDRAKAEDEPYVPQEPTPYLRAVRTGVWISREEVILLAGRYGVKASDDVVWQWKHRKKIIGRTVSGEAEYELASVQGYLHRRTNRERMTA